MRRAVAAASVVFLLAGCDAPFVERATRVLVEAGDGYWETPLPFELREEGLDLADPAATGELVEAARAALDGSWTDAAITLPLTGMPDASTLPEAGAGRDDTVFVTTLDESPGRVPVLVTVEPEEGARPTSLVVSLAGATPLEGTRYAAVVTDFLRDENNSRVGRSEPFNSAWEGNDDADPALRELMLEVRAALVRDGVELHSVAGVAVFEAAAGVGP